MSQATKPPSPFVFILGMHRSGTSCLAGALEHCGLFLGEVRRTGRFNAKGYFEMKAVTHLHDQILGMNRSAWHQPPEQTIVHPYHQKALRDLADQLSAHRPCGLKDPRTLLMLDTWLTLAPPPHALVGTFRHPRAVAASLHKRNGLSEDMAQKLWFRYNTRLVEAHRRMPFPILLFDLSDPTLYGRTLADLAKTLGLVPDMSGIQTFVNPDLDHHRGSYVPVPTALQSVWDYLMQHRFQPTA